MVRVTKDPEVRRNELLDAAQALFCEKGYEGTSVNMIIKRVGVAKGTFYHYFSSKNDLVEGLAQRVTDQIMVAIDTALAEAPALDAIARFNLLCQVSARWKAEHLEVIQTLMAAMYQEDNLVLRSTVTKMLFAEMVPLFTDIIAHGVDEELFDTISPPDASRAILFLAVGMRETLAPIVMQLKQAPPADEVAALFARLDLTFRFFTQSIERVLGAAPGSLDIGGGEFLARFRQMKGTV